MTVYRALRALLPNEDFVYLGDTARLPYGTKSKETVTQYAAQAARLLLDEDIKLLVVACNTASAFALDGLRKLLPDTPCLGVIEPGAAAAAAATQSGAIVVLATAGTVKSGAYQNAILRLKPDADIRAIPCGLLVALAEEGWGDGAEAEAIIRRYMKQAAGRPFDTLVLGCTHFPLLTSALRRVLGERIHFVDSAATTASVVRDYLTSHQLVNRQGRPGRSRFWCTDAPENFLRIAEHFLPEENMDTIRMVAIK